MTTITTIGSGDQISNSRSDINANFANLNSDKIETSVIDTDTSLAANSDSKLPSQKAIKAYVDNAGGTNASETARGLVEEGTDAEVTAGSTTGSTGAKLFVTPAKLETRLNAKWSFRGGAVTKNISDANTTQTIAHGLGYTPRRVRFTTIFAIGDELFTSYGVYDASGQRSISQAIDASSNAVISTAVEALVIWEGDASSQSQAGTVSVDATNISITWVKSGTPASGTANILWEAE